MRSRPLRSHPLSGLFARSVNRRRAPAGTTTSSVKCAKKFARGFAPSGMPEFAAPTSSGPLPDRLWRPSLSTPLVKKADHPGAVMAVSEFLREVPTHRRRLRRRPSSYPRARWGLRLRSRRRDDVIGPPGTGKSHLSLALGVEAVKAGRSVSSKAVGDVRRHRIEAARSLTWAHRRWISRKRSSGSRR